MVFGISRQSPVGNNTILLEKMDEVRNQLEGMKHLHKTIFNTEEASEYTSLAPSYVDKLCSKRLMPFYQPRGKLKYFKREELDNWLLRNRKDTIDEMAESRST